MEGATWQELVRCYLRLLLLGMLPEGVVLKSTLQDGSIVFGRNQRGHGGRGIFVLGDRLEPELPFMREVLRPGDVLIDVGASVGAYTMVAAKKIGPDGIVVALEPLPETAGMLFSNVRANSLSNVRIRVLAGSNRTGCKLFWLSDAPNDSSFTRRHHSKSISVLAAKLDDLIQWENLDRVDYLKMDAEGEELPILEGAREIIERFRPIIQREIGVDQVAHVNLDGYRNFAFSRSANRLHIPSEREDVIQAVMNLGAREVG